MKKTHLKLGFLAGLLTLLLAVSSYAATERLDDSASPRSRVQPQFVMGNDGHPIADSFGATSATARYGRVEFKLATARFMGRQARIYFVIPAAIAGLNSPAGLRVDWQGNGVLSNGFARPGERALVWSGTVREPWMSESLDLTLQINLRELRLPPSGNLGFEPYFEIETTP